jgi:hypothetical protein
LDDEGQPRTPALVSVIKDLEMLRSSSRELSARVDLKVHRRPNRVRRKAWWLALLAGAASFVWVCLQHSRGENQIYQAGDVTNPHHLIENECQRCHTKWTPLQRLLSFDLKGDLHSIDNKACEQCHHVVEHHKNQIPEHSTFSCAACHQEHEGAEMLTSPSDRHCTNCHDNLKGHGDNAGKFANLITRFDQTDGHPEFRLLELLKNEANAAEPHKDHGVHKSLAKFQRERLSLKAPAGDDAPKWQDPGRIYFNHAVHLKPDLPGEDRKPITLVCKDCHEADDDHRFFNPIAYESHCRKCHPLLFDHFNFPGQKVPHETPEVVRGFLTEQYTLRALSGAAANLQKPEPDPPSRPIPGHRDFQRPKLSKEQAESVRAGVARAEKNARDGFGDATELTQLRQQRLLGPESSGGCGYCHEITSSKPQETATLADWNIVETKIPSRWFMHGSFHHDPHRLLSCSACHKDVEKKQNTGDVMLPSIKLCRACHTARPQDSASMKELGERASNSGSETTQSLQELLSHVNRGARHECIECHKYHNPKEVKWDGPFAP